MTVILSRERTLMVQLSKRVVLETLEVDMVENATAENCTAAVETFF